MLKSLTMWITTNWKILKEMRIPDHLICLLQNLYADQETTARTRQGTMDWFKIGKGILQGCILSPCLFNLYSECIMGNAGLDELQVGIKIAKKNIKTFSEISAASGFTLMTESTEELKSLLMRVKEESEKAGLKLNIQKAKTKESGPITSGQIDREKVETVTNSIFLGSKITADSDYSHEIKRHFLLGKKVMTSLNSVVATTPVFLLGEFHGQRSLAGCSSWGHKGSDTTEWLSTAQHSVLKSRDIALPASVHIAKALVFPVVIYGCESWTRKKAEHQRIAFELWCWRRLLGIPWAAKRSNRSILKEINFELLLEALMLKLKLQYFGHLMRRADSLQKTLMLERIRAGESGNRGWDILWYHQLNGHEFGQTLQESEGQGSLACCSPWSHKESDTT